MTAQQKLACYPFNNISGAGVAVRFENAPRFSLLLNNTAALHGHTHFGPNHVVKALVDGLETVGIPPLAFANSDDALKRITAILPHPPAVVVINGEGTMHHDQSRVCMLLQMAQRFKSQGIPVVLINSIWQENSEQALRDLAAFDLVAVRESQSMAALKSARPDARIVPDLLLTGLPQKSSPSDLPDTLGVVDCSHAPVARKMMRFAVKSAAQFYVMEQRNLPNPAQAERIGLPTDQIKHATLDHMGAHARWITGRFHFALALLRTGRSFAALPTQVHKMQAMLGDAGLSAALLPDNWTEMGFGPQRTAADTAMNSWDATMFKRAIDYTTLARSASADLFADIAALAR